MTLYGIPTCDTCRKARKALEGAGHDVVLRDVRADGLSDGEVMEFVARFGEAVVNRKSATWRGLSEAERAGDPAALISAHPTLMKRPVIGDGATLTIGWDKDVQAGWGVSG
ncbi:MAG: ArsC/Spx/MgsR family protein [Pseudomonadota bacterium]